MTRMPPKSSATANVAKNIFRPMGTRLPNMESTPNENAMSVAMGMAVPRSIRASSGQVRKKKKISTGMAMPPQAPMMGEQGFLQCRQFSHQDFPFDFQSHGKEKQSHEEIVDKVHQAEAFFTVAEQIEVTDRETDRLLPQGTVGVSPTGIGHYHGYNRDDNQNQAGVHVFPEHAKKSVIPHGF